MRRLLFAAILALTLGMSPEAHAASVFTDGGERPLALHEASGVVNGTVRSRPGTILQRRKLWQYRGPNAEFNPFSVEHLPNGNVLIASRSNEVLEVTRAGSIVWSYTKQRDDPRLLMVYSAQRLANGNTLIVDRRADFVIEVTPDKREVWRYGATQDSLAAGSLVDPFYAVRMPNGNTLITDNRGGNRVIEVRGSDYEASAPNLGYDASSVVWHYGSDGVAGLGPHQLVSPRHAVRTPQGTTLITDSGDRDADAHRVIEVDSAGDVVWSFGEPGVAGLDATHLTNPSAAYRLADGNTLMADEGGRILEIDPAGKIVDWFGPGGFVSSEGGYAIRAIARSSAGSTFLCDQNTHSVIEFGYPRSGTFVSRDLNLDAAGAMKVIKSIEVVADCPVGTSVSVEYALDGGSVWKGSGERIVLPADTVASWLRYRLTLRTDSAAHTPVVREVVITYDYPPAPSDQVTPTTPGGTGGKTPHSPSGAGHGGSGGGTASTAGASGIPAGTLKVAGNDGIGQSKQPATTGQTQTDSAGDSVSGFALSETTKRDATYDSVGGSGETTSVPQDDATASALFVLLLPYVSGVLWTVAPQFASRLYLRVAAVFAMH